MAWLMGGAAGYQTDVGERPGKLLIPVASFVLLGALAAADLKLPDWLMLTTATCMGRLHGVINGIAVREAGEDPLGLLGMAATVFSSSWRCCRRWLSTSSGPQPGSLSPSPGV